MQVLCSSNGGSWQKSRFLFKAFLKSTKAAGKLKFTQNDKFDYNLENDYWIPHSQHKKIIDQVWGQDSQILAKLQLHVLDW